MPGKVKVKIIAGRNLPVMDRSSDTTDAYVEIKLGNTTYKTDVCRKSLHPQWNSDWYRFEVDDSELQDEPLQIRLMDHDTYSANDAIGKVYLDLNPLLLPAASLLRASNDNEPTPNSSMSGWIPVYDTMHGIRGEVNIIVKVELFIDFNKFRQSSCGVQFFCTPAIPQGYYAQVVHGFVEELVVNDDPEYQWIDKIRTPRASNEARQTLFFKLSGELQRKIGVKALDLGGNAVIGYSQAFDLEGDSGIVARGIGTVVTLIKIADSYPHIPHDQYNEERAISYIKFLSSDKGFYLNKRPHISNFNKLFPILPKTSPVLPPKLPADKPLLVAEGSVKKLVKQNTLMEFAPLPKPLIQHSHSLQTLLKQEDMRGTPGTGFSQRLKNLKYSSQTLLSKKMTALKAKLTDSATPDEPKAVSTGDLGEPKKKKHKFRRTISDSSTMAELLVRSVLHVHSSLDCISESPPNPPIFQKQMSLNDSTIEKNDDPSEASERKGSSYLSLPDDSCDASSNPSEVSDSSSSDDEFSESKDSRIDYDTVSGIVKNVRKLSMLNASTSENNLMQNVDILEQHLEVDSEYDDNSESIKGSTVSPDDLEKPQWMFDVNIDKKDEDAQGKVVFTVGDGVDEHFVPPIAELDEFIQTSDDEEKTPVADRTPRPLSEEPLEPTLILPPIMMNPDIETKGLFKTAMEVMLLDKINLMGTYTPPTSPPIHTKDKTFNIPSHYTPTSPEKNESFFPKIRETFEIIRRSSTSTSLSDYDKKQFKRFNSLHNMADKTDHRRSMLSLQDHTQPHKPDTVLGAPFTALHHRTMSIKGSKAKSNSVANSPNEYEHKHHFASLDDVNIKTTKHHSFLCKAEKKVKHAFHAPFALLQNIHRDSKKRLNEKRENKLEHGLLGTALENVLMDTVNDLLITSHVENKEAEIDKPQENKNIECSTSEIPSEPVIIIEETADALKAADDASPVNPLTTNVDQNLSHPAPINLEIDGVNIANTLHASFGPCPRQSGSPLPDQHRHEHGHQRTESMGAKISQSPAKLNAISCIHRRSSDSDLSITPKGNSLTGSDRSSGAAGFQMMKKSFIRSTVPHENFDYMEYPFLTMAKYPPGFVTHLGGAVSARSVKLLERISNLEEPESRDTWWSEIRMEIRSHARALNCNAVLNYSENTTICEDVCVITASGTAAVIGYHRSSRDSLSRVPTMPKHHNAGKEVINDRDDKDKKYNEASTSKAVPESPEHDILPGMNNSTNLSCGICHLPYTPSVNLRATSAKCRMCSSAKVPDVLLATIEIPEGVPIIGRGCFVQSVVCRPMKEIKGETFAKEISDGLPFLEYELHRILVNKLKVKGMNAIFGLKVRISIGEKMMIGIATGTAVFLSALPSPPLPKLVSDRSADDKKLASLQKDLHETVKKNKEIYQLEPYEEQNGKPVSDNEESEDEQAIMELNLTSKDCCILEIDDPEDAEVVNLLMEPRPPDGFHVVNTESVPGLEDLEIVKNLQMFIQVWRAKVQPPYNLDKTFHRLLETVYFKLRRMIPCALCDLQFRVESPEADEIQLCVLGMALGLGDPQKNPKRKLKSNHLKRTEDELIFNLEEINQIPENSVFQPPPNAGLLNMQLSKHRQKSPQRKKSAQRHTPHRERYGVDLTPLSYVPGGKIERYLGNLNFFFIRETTSIREEGGVSGFIHSFITEVLAIVRAHVTALGGNAMVAYFMTECVLNHNLHKNQGQCLVNIGGDVVSVSYFSEEQ